MLRIFIIILALLLPSCALVGPVLAASGAARTVETDVLSRLAVEDSPKHELTQALGIDAVTSLDPVVGISIDGARLKTRFQADLVDGVGLVRGYGILEGPSGDTLHVVFGYQIPPGPEMRPGSSRGPSSGPVEPGRLLGFGDRGTLSGEIDSTWASRYRWEASYRIRKDPI